MVKHRPSTERPRRDREALPRHWLPALWRSQPAAASDRPMSTPTNPAYLPIHALSAAIQARRLSPVELTENLLGRIARLDGKLHAFIALYADDARLAAEAAEK